jgi:hypothetical protein
VIEKLDWRSKDIKWTDLVEKMNEIIDFINKEFFSTPVSAQDAAQADAGDRGEDAARDSQDDAGGEADANRIDWRGEAG